MLLGPGEMVAKREEWEQLQEVIELRQEVEEIKGG